MTPLEFVEQCLEELGAKDYDIEEIDCGGPHVSIRYWSHASTWRKARLTRSLLFALMNSGIELELVRRSVKTAINLELLIPQTEETNEGTK